MHWSLIYLSTVTLVFLYYMYRVGKKHGKITLEDAYHFSIYSLCYPAMFIMDFIIYVTENEIVLWKSKKGGRYDTSN